jgi:hypothetical protein
MEAWSSADGRSWELAHAFAPDEEVHTLTAGGPGFVVAGSRNADAAVWVSTEGREWLAVRDPSLGRGSIFRLVPTASGLVAFGSGGVDAGAIWTSPDGTDWLAATNETGLTVAGGLQAVGSHDGRAIAFVSQSGEGPTAIWETTGRAEWNRVGALAEDGATVVRVAGGVGGWVALGSTVDAGNLAWASSDGRAWTPGVSGPDVREDTSPYAMSVK